MGKIDGSQRRHNIALPSTSSNENKARTQERKNSPARDNPNVRTHQGQSDFEAGTKKANPPALDANAVLPAKLNPASVQKANEHYEKLKGLNPAGAAKSFAKTVEAHKSEPDYVAQLVNRAREKGGLLDNLARAHDGFSPFAKDENGNYSREFMESERKAITDALSTARAKGYLTDQDVRDHATDNTQWQDIASRLSVRHVGRLPGADAPLKEVHGAKTRFEKARDQVREKNERPPCVREEVASAEMPS
ncbi:hypothetical protein HUA78_45555 [Myxococcus sp. CA033]|uniref:hypothetical protein n=1 Tax=Myxococcus sp. CA033 TaxID=2741516 RepID=UPI00157A8A91|nr:hypothetical protein [Myxococcus sp. CA033]NTX41710.1 hypothetical protein [Myxococcus sp. CA033]